MPKEKQEITPQQAEKTGPVTTDEETNRLFEEGDIDDLVDESPVVSGAVVEKDIEMAKKNETDTTNESEKAQTEPKETTEQTEEKTAQDEKSQATSEEEQASEPEPNQEEPEKVIIGDQEYTPEEVALFKSEFDKKKAWEERLRNQSVISSNLSDEEIEAAIAVVSGERKLPDQSAEVAESISLEVLGDKPIVKKDDEGYEIDVTSEVKEAVAKAVKATLSRVAPVLDKAKKDIVDSQRKAVSTFITTFMDNHPEYKLVVPEGTPIDQYMDTVGRTGPDHPDYASYARYNVLSDAAKRMGYVGPEALEQAYTFLYGNHEGKVLTAEEKAERANDAQTKILKKQEKVSQEKPGGQIESKDDIDIILDEVGDPATKALEELGVL